MLGLESVTAWVDYQLSLKTYLTVSPTNTMETDVRAREVIAPECDDCRISVTHSATCVYATDQWVEMDPEYLVALTDVNILCTLDSATQRTMELQRVEFTINDAPWTKWWDNVEDAGDESLCASEWSDELNGVKVHVLYVPGQSTNLSYKIFLYLQTLAGENIPYNEATPEEGGPPIVHEETDETETADDTGDDTVDETADDTGDDTAADDTADETADDVVVEAAG